MNKTVTGYEGNSSNSNFNVEISFNPYQNLAFRTHPFPNRMFTDSQSYYGKESVVVNINLSGIALLGIENANTSERNILVWRVDEDLSEEELEKKFAHIIKDSKNLTYLIVNVNKKNSPDQEIIELCTIIDRLAKKILNDSDSSISSTPVQKLSFETGVGGRSDLVAFSLNYHGKLLFDSNQESVNDIFPNVLNENRKNNPLEYFRYINKEGKSVLPTNKEELKEAYKQLALLRHPDKNIDNPDATGDFQNLRSRYEILLAQFGDDFNA
jgi:hypothetical protein